MNKFIKSFITYLVCCSFNMLVLWLAIGVLINNYDLYSWSNEVKVMWLGISYIITELGILQHRINKK